MSDFYQLPAKKSLGQHFLKNPHVIDAIVDAATLEHGEIVLEIGPGTGALTETLLASGAHVIAIEADDRAIPLLAERFSEALLSGQLALHHTDVRTSDFGQFIEPNTPYTIVANIPYYLSGMLVRGALERDHQPEKVVFLVQKEVAERIARSEKESLLSLSVKAYGEPSYIATVKRGNFTPPPAVDSAILAIRNISKKRFTQPAGSLDNPLDEHWFFTVLHAGFAARRKQLFGNLLAIAPHKALEEAFATLGIARTTRGEDLSIDTWCALAQALVHVQK